MSELTTNVIHTSDSMERLDELLESSVHAVVTDPPYGLAFMGRDWDDFKPKEYQEWCEMWARKCKRVLKPGGHLLAFSGNRTHHRLFTGVEDAGYEIRDTVTWHYGNGFPKNNDTCLKPASEFVVMARVPFDDTAELCYEKNGTAHLNIEECRIETDGERANMVRKERESSGNSLEGSVDQSLDSGTPDGMTDMGRHPSNVVFDKHQAETLDAEVGETPSCDPHTLQDKGERDVYSNNAPNKRHVGYKDSGGPSRYFYTSKASKAERTLDGRIDNAHPTVKPMDLMEWLVKLVTREGQIVLDPFAGSGTTCKAAKTLNREFIGIERQADHADVARVRVGLTPDDPSVVRGDDLQTGLEAFE